MKKITLILMILLVFGCEQKYGEKSSFQKISEILAAASMSPQEYTDYQYRQAITDYYKLRIEANEKGGYIGDYNGEPIVLLPDGKGGYIGEIEGKPIVLLPE